MSSIFHTSLFVITILGCLIIPKWAQKNKHKHWLFYELIWFSLNLMIYVIVLESIHGSFYFLIPSFFLGLFILSYRCEKRRLINGGLFNLFLVVSAFYLAFLVFATESLVLIRLAFIVAVIALIFLLLGWFLLLIFLYVNAYIVYKKEGLSLGNMLTFLLALALTLVSFVDPLTTQFLPEWAIMFIQIFPIWGIYLGIVFYNFLTISVIYQFNQPRYDKDYVIVLGAGLIGGDRISRLLGNRIDMAINFYKKQKINTLYPIKIVMSGGQGSDEKLPEAEAMRKYAVDKGIAFEDVLAETKSTSTLENMAFSKELMTKDFGSKAFKTIFTTNNYHLFRAGVFAKEAGLEAEGIGADTKGYFIPNAFLREFVAILVMHKKRHLLIMGIIAIIIIFMAAILFYTEYFV